MKNKLIMALLASFLLSGAALADDDCTDPVADWQPRERLRQMMVDRGWEVKRIKVDDGCYEVKGVDRKGHRVEAKFSPASLKILELEVEFDESGDASDYLDTKGMSRKSGAPMNSGNQATQNKSKATIE